MNEWNEIILRIGTKPSSVSWQIETVETTDQKAEGKSVSVFSFHWIENKTEVAEEETVWLGFWGLSLLLKWNNSSVVIQTSSLLGR